MSLGMAVEAAKRRPKHRAAPRGAYRFAERIAELTAELVVSPVRRVGAGKRVAKPSVQDRLIEVYKAQEFHTREQS